MKKDQKFGMKTKNTDRDTLPTISEEDTSYIDDNANKEDKTEKDKEKDLTEDKEKGVAKEIEDEKEKAKQSRNMRLMIYLSGEIFKNIYFFKFV
jgi:hypothetical protein